MSTEKPEAPFELIVGEKNGEIHSGDIPVRWCVSADQIAKMEKQGVQDPHVLLVTTTPSGHEMQRQIVPLTEFKTYARFTRAGKMNLHAWIIDGVDGRKKLKEHTKKYGGEYVTTLFDYGEPIAPGNYDKFLLQTSLEVIIPAGVFGKEPSPAIKWFANLWHSKDRVADECEFRRRLILAFTLKWIPVLLYIVLYSAFRVGLALGFAGAGFYSWIDWKVVHKIFTYANISYIFLPDSYSNSSFIFNIPIGKSVSGRKLSIESYVALPFMPTYVFTMLGLFYLIRNTIEFEVLVTMVAAPLGIAIAFDLVRIVGIVLFKLSVSRNLMMYISDKLHKFNNWMIEKEYWAPVFLVATIVAVIGSVVAAVMFIHSMMYIAAAVAILIACLLIGYKVIEYAFKTPDYQDVRELLCPKDMANLDTSSNSVPFQYRSIRLWYLDFKNKVCKPMQV